MVVGSYRLTIKNRVQVFALLIPLVYGLVAPFFTYEHFGAIIHPGRIPPNRISENESRLAPARTAFRPYQHVGYLSSDMLTNPEEGLHYSLALYALVPTILLRDPRLDLILVDTPPDSRPLPADPAFRRVADLAPGVTLYRRSLR